MEETLSATKLLVNYLKYCGLSRRNKKYPTNNKDKRAATAMLAAPIIPAVFFNP